MMYERREFLKSSSSGILRYKIKSRKAGKKERKYERKTKHRVSVLVDLGCKMSVFSTI